VSILREIWLPVAIIAVLVAVLVGAYAFVGQVLAPRWIVDAARAHVEGRLGLRLAVGHVEVAPFSLAARVQDVAITTPDAQRLVSFGELGVDLSAASLWRRSLVIERAALVAPRIDATLSADRRLNLLALLSPPDTARTPGSSGHEALPAIELAEFVVSAGAGSFEDRGREPALRVELQPIEFTLRDFSTRRDAGNWYRLQARAVSGESLQWQGSFDLQPFAARGEFSLAGVSANTVQRYAGALLPFDVADGQLRLAASYEIVARQLGGVDVRATVERLDAANLAFVERVAGRSGAGEPAAATEEGPAVRIAGLALRGARVDLGGRRIDLGRVGVQGLQVAAVRDANGFNLERMLRRDDPDDTPTTWTVALPRIAVVDAAIRFEDRRRTPVAVLPLDALKVVATGYDSAADSEVALDLDGRLAGGALSLAAKLTLPEPALRGRFELQGFDLLTLTPYLAERVRLDLRSGRLDLAGEIDSKLSERALAFDGRLAVRELLTRDKAVGRDLVKWRRVAVDGLQLQSDFDGRGRLRVATVIADAPYIDLVIGPDGRTNVADVLATAAPEPGVAPSGEARAAMSPAPRPLAVTIDRVRIRDGSANFADLSVTPNFGTGIQTLSGTVTGLSSAPDSRAKVALAGQVDRYAPVSIDGEINYLAARSYTDLKVVFRNMELTTLNPYSGKFAGYRIERGKLSADFAYRVADRKLDAEHKILLTQLQLGERVESPDAVGLPLKLAIALLKDRNGNIELDLPVSGSLDDPQFRIGPIVWRMFVNLVGKIATAPFALLGSLFGGGEESRFVEFAPGSAALDPAMQARLAGVRKALVDRPELRLELPLATDSERDGEVLRDRAWQRELQQFAPPALRADRGRYLKLLTSRYAASGADPAPLLASLEAAGRDALREQSIATLETRLRAAVAVTAADLEALARARAAAVQDALLQSGEIEPERVFITRPAPATTAGDAVRLELALSVD
jgi:uncharacterized protein involved in outer membrane biogenesis